MNKGFVWSYDKVCAKVDQSEQTPEALRILDEKWRDYGRNMIIGEIVGKRIYTMGYVKLSKIKFEYQDRYFLICPKDLGMDEQFFDALVTYFIYDLEMIGAKHIYHSFFID